MILPKAISLDGLVHYENSSLLEIGSQDSRDDALLSTLPVIYVVIPTYNSGATLEKTIRSLLYQQYPNLMIVVYDGGSCDDSTIPILRYYSRYINLIISKPDKGQADVINKGFARAPRRSVLGWLNADDILLPGALLSLGKTIVTDPEASQAVEANSAAMFVGDADLVDPDHNLIHAKRLSKERLGRDYLIDYRNNYIIQPSCFFTKQLWDLAGPNNPDLYAAFDFELFYKMAGLAKVVVHIPYVMSYSVFHEDCKTVKQRHLSISETALIQAREGGFHYALREVQELSKEYKFLERVLNDTKYTKPAILISITEFGLGGAQTYLITLLKQISGSFRIFLYRHWTHRTSDELLSKALHYCQDITPYINNSIEGLRKFIAAQGIRLVLSNLFHSDLHMANVCHETGAKLIVVDHGDYRFVVEDGHASVEDVRHIFSVAYKFIYTAECIKESALLRYFSSQEEASRKLEYIPLPCDGVDTQLSSEALCAALDLPLDSFLVSYSGRGIISKGWPYAVEAIAAANRISERPIALIGIGSGDAIDCISSQLETINPALGSYIRLLGFRRDAPAIAAACHAAMMLSYYPGETLNLTLIESLMAGKPCIATRWGAMGEVLKFDHDDAAGIPISIKHGVPLVSDGIDALVAIANNKETYTKLCENSQRRSKHFESARVCSIYTDLLSLWAQS